jgi:hypothetical protein
LAVCLDQFAVVADSYSTLALNAIAAVFFFFRAQSWCSVVADGRPETAPRINKEIFGDGV